MTADLEAVTRELLRVIPCEVFNAPATCLWSCEERTCDSCQKVAKLTAVLASLPDDRLAEAEAKVRRVEKLADLEAGTHEVVPWKAGDTTSGYCGKATKHVTKTVNPLNWNAPDRLAVYCSTGACPCSMKVSDLPKRYRVTEEQFQAAAAKAVRAALSGGDAT